jgi:hypothetical protein
MQPTKAALRDEVEKLAEQAFRRNLISGYGDGPLSNEYQLVQEGKPRHYSLEYARYLLLKLLNQGESF